MPKLRAILLAAIVGCASAASAEEAIVVIVNFSNAVGRIGPGQLRQIFQGQRTHWPNRWRVRIVLPADDDPAMAYLARDVLRVGSVDSVARFYLERIFQQRATNMPPQLSSGAALAYVARERGAIALITSNAARHAPGVRVLPMSD